MSDKIPLEIQMEIIQRISDIKLVIQYRSVSKAWKSIIDSKEFVSGHTLRRHIQRQLRRHLLLIRGKDSGDLKHEVKYVSIVDNDDTFPHQKVKLFVPDFCKNSRLVGSCLGLCCLYNDERNMVVIWNPLIRKTVFIPYDELSTSRVNDVVFGVCPDNLDTKIVKISYDDDTRRNARPRVEVFTLNLGSWRSPLSNTRPRKSISLGYTQAVVDRFIYWDALDIIYNVDGDVLMCDIFIMSFDLKSEEFVELYLPNPPNGALSVSNLRDSLGVFDVDCSTNDPSVNVWMVKGYGCKRSFEKLYHVSPSDASSINMALGFRRSGAPIVEVENGQTVALAAYEPESKEFTEIWRYGMSGTFHVHSYMETLLLLDC